MSVDAGTDQAAQHRLVLLRHAKSSWKEEDLDDADRPLAPRGRRDATAAGHWLAQHVGVPDLVLCSTAVRTRQTWELASEAEPDVLAAAPVQLEAAVYEARPKTLLELVRRLPEDVGTVVLVGHSPGVPDLADRIWDVGRGSVGDFPTCALASFTLDRPWADLGARTATLDAYAVPRG